MPDHRTGLYDIAIVGGGPAGLTAAIWAGRYGRRVLLVDSGDPRNWETRGINGFLGLPGVRPAELRGRGREEARRYDVTLLDTTVLRVERCDEGEPNECIALHLQGGDTSYARRLLLAIGLKDVWPDIPGLEQAYGANAHVCPDCDGYEARGKRIVVIGNGRRALGMAVSLTTWSDRITIATNGRPADLEEEGYEEKLAANGIAVRTEPVRRVCCSGSTISCLELDSGERLDADKVFFTIAQRPADDLGVQLGCDRDSGGHIVVSDHCSTSVRSVFAAGDITPGPQLAIRAAAAGAVAALSMHKSLLPVERTLKDV
jgi:thioredoxin reductase